jgi:hypothetical protein
MHAIRVLDSRAGQTAYTLPRVLHVRVGPASGRAARIGHSLSYVQLTRCAPVAAASDGTMVWYSKNTSGVLDAYIGNGDCQGAALLPPYGGNRGPTDMTADGRYVLLTTAVG